MIQVNVPLFGIGVDQVTNEKGQRMPVLTIQHLLAVGDQGVPTAQYQYMLDPDVARQIGAALTSPSVQVARDMPVAP